MVQEFHELFGHPVNALKPHSADLATYIDLRVKLMREELAELEEALDSGDLDQILKEACDLDYVLKGTLVAMQGIGDPERTGAFAEVHRSNMSKVGPDGKPVYRDDGKVMKGPGFSPADMTPFLTNDENK